MGLNSRIIGFDLARAWAVFGMVVVNFKVVMGAGQRGPDWLVTLVGGLDGRAAATFVVLAGIGLSLVSRTARMTGDREQLARHRTALLKRALFLFSVGLLYTPIWPADILHFYGVYIGVGAFLLAVRTKHLWTIAASLVIAFVLALATLDYESGWDWNSLSYEGFWTPGGMIRHLFFNGFHPVLPWLAFLLVGMALGRMDLRAADVRRRVFGWGLFCALVAEVSSRWLTSMVSSVAGASEQQDLAALFGTAPMPPTPLYMVAGAGTACAVIAVAVALGERFGEARWLRPLVATGQLALTLYVVHVVIGMGTLEALGRLEHQTLAFAVSAAAVFCVASVVAAALWRKHFRRGPLEAIMRRLTS